MFANIFGNKKKKLQAKRNRVVHLAKLKGIRIREPDWVILDNYLDVIIERGMFLQLYADMITDSKEIMDNANDSVSINETMDDVIDEVLTDDVVNAYIEEAKSSLNFSSARYSSDLEPKYSPNAKEESNSSYSSSDSDYSSSSSTKSSSSSSWSSSTDTDSGSSYTSD